MFPHSLRESTVTTGPGMQVRSRSDRRDWINVAAEAWNQTEPPYSGEASNASDALDDDNESVAPDGNLSNRNLVSV